MPTIKNHINLRIDVETASHMRHTKTAIESGAGTQGVRYDEGLETSAFRISVRWPIHHYQIFVYYFPPTQHHSFFGNYPLHSFVRVMVCDRHTLPNCDVDLSLVRLNDCTKRLYKTLPANPQHTKRLSNAISLINLEHISDYIHNLTGT